MFGRGELVRIERWFFMFFKVECLFSTFLIFGLTVVARLISKVVFVRYVLLCVRGVNETHVRGRVLFLVWI